MDKDIERNNFMKNQLKNANFKRISGVIVKNQTKYKINVKSIYKQFERF